MTRTLDYLISDTDYTYNQKLYDFRIINNGIVFLYSFNPFYSLISTFNHVCSNYTINNIYVKNINDTTFVELISKYSENRYITPKDIKYILSSNNCIPNLTESREKEWDTIGFSKWIVIF